MNFLKMTPILMLWLIGAWPLHASRTIYSTPTGQRTETTTPQQLVKGTVSRISLQFKNISNIEQNLTVQVSTLERIEEVFFNSPGTTGPLSSWETNHVLTYIKRRIFAPPPAERTLTLQPLESKVMRVGIACVFNNATDSSGCSNSGEANVATASLLPDTFGAAIANYVSLEITVREDKGAILADYTIQDVIGGGSFNVDSQMSRALNGGAPF